MHIPPGPGPPPPTPRSTITFVAPYNGWFTFDTCPSAPFDTNIILDGVEYDDNAGYVIPTRIFAHLSNLLKRLHATFRLLLALVARERADRTQVVLVVLVLVVFNTNNSQHCNCALFVSF